MAKKEGIKEILVNLYEEERPYYEPEYEKYKKVIEKRLISFYDSGAKHRYSEVTTFVVEVFEEADSYMSLEEAKGEINNLSNILNDIANKIFDRDLKDNLDKLLDHIDLEVSRNFSMRKRELDLIMKIENFNVQLVNMETKRVTLDKEIEKVDGNIKNMKFDLIALVTLVFTGFTVVSSNVSIVTAIMNAKEIQYTPFEIVISLIMCNLMIVLVIFSIYSIVRKIHGDIKTSEMYWSLGVSTIILILLVLILSVFIVCG